MENTNYTEWLRVTLKEKGITQAELSKALGYHEAVVNQKLRRKSFTVAEKCFTYCYINYPNLTKYILKAIANKFNE